MSTVNGAATVIKYILLVLSLAILYVYGFGSVDKSITPSDADAIQSLEVGGVCAMRSSFDDEITCIKAVQNAIRSLITNFKCAPNGELIEPASFIRRNYGCCFDRARFTEKALTHFGYKTRHVALYDRDAHGLFGLLVPGIDSHATTEVRTSKGWMGVDSLNPFLLITNSNQVHTYSSFKNNIDDLRYQVEPKWFFDKNLIVVYGLYSRHGMFHGYNLPTPEFNLSEILYNFGRS